MPCETTSSEASRKGRTWAFEHECDAINVILSRNCDNVIRTSAFENLEHAIEIDTCIMNMSGAESQLSYLPCSIYVSMLVEKHTHTDGLVTSKVLESILFEFQSHQ